tara:strand:- start:82 stop:807 length:726 start_codon:yes stop_codon:yes gene_type:complete
MSIGNLKTDGGKGTNWPWQYKMLKGLQGIIDVINSTANGSEYEAQLVNIDCPDPIVPPAPHAGVKLYLEVRTWDTVTGGFTNVSYYLPGSNTAYPAVDFAGCTVTYLEAGDATEATLAEILTKNTEIEVDTTAIATSAATTATNTTAIEDDTSSLNDTSAMPAMLRATASGLVTIAAPMKSVSFYNAAAGDANVLGVVLKQGETVNFDAGGNMNKFAGNTFDYDADISGGNAGDLLIIYVA